jgi:hypothetical protein
MTSEETRIASRKLAPWLFLWAAILMSLMMFFCSEAPMPQPDFKEWEWAECLPSAYGQDCSGDKPSWIHFQNTGQIIWRYEVEGRSIYKDEYGTTWRIYDYVYCLDYSGKRVGTHRNMGFRSFQFRPDPITGELPNSDDIGVISGTLCIFGVIKDGRVLPVLW